MSRTVWTVAAALFALSVARLSAAPIDPFSFDNYPDPGLDSGLALLAPANICFPDGGNTECLEDAEITATSPVSDAYNYDGSEEQDSFNAQMTANVYQNGVYMDSVTLNGSADTVDDRTDSADWLTPYDTQMVGLDLSGVDALLGNVELSTVPDSSDNGSATISQTGGGYNISSFFDVFTEISLDGGSTYVPTNPTATEFDLAYAPEPASAALLFPAALLLLALSRRRRHCLHRL